VPPRLPSDELDATPDGKGVLALGLQLQPEPLPQEARNGLPPLHELRRCLGEQHQIVDVAEIEATPEGALHELIQLVQVDVAPELTREVSNRQAAFVLLAEETLAKRNGVRGAPRRTRAPVPGLEAVGAGRVMK